MKNKSRRKWPENIFEWLTDADVMELLKINKSQLAYGKKTGKISYTIFMNRKIFYRKDHIMELKREKEIKQRFDDCMTAAEVMELLQISKSQLAYLRRSHQIKYQRHTGSNKTYYIGHVMNLKAKREKKQQKREKKQQQSLPAARASKAAACLPTSGFK